MLGVLRQLEYNSIGKTKQIGVINIKCFYRDIRDNIPLPLAPTNSKKASKDVITKGKVRRVNLMGSDEDQGARSSPSVDNGFFEDKLGSEEQQDNKAGESEEEVIVKKGKKEGKKQRNTITRKLLDTKHARKVIPKEEIRQKIYILHHCLNSRCNNFKGCCYILPSIKSYHKLDMDLQETWAEYILLKLENTTEKLPPTSWTSQFIDS